MLATVAEVLLVPFPKHRIDLFEVKPNEAVAQLEQSLPFEVARIPDQANAQD